jgi:hypothetical protein
MKNIEVIIHHQIFLHQEYLEPLVKFNSFAIYYNIIVTQKRNERMMKNDKWIITYIYFIVL